MGNIIDIKNIFELIKWFENEKDFQNSPMLKLFIMLFIFLLIFLPYISTILKINSSKIKSIETLLQNLKNKNFTESTHVFLKEYLETEYVKKITGFWVEKNIRDEMIKWNKEFGIGIADLRKAQSYIHNENLIVDIEINGFEWIFNALVFIGTFLAAFLSMIMLFNSILQERQVGIAALLFLYCIATFIFVVHSQTVPCYSAWKVKKIKDQKISL